MNLGTETRRRSNARWGAAMGLTVLARIHLGQYTGFGQIAIDAKVTEATVRHWVRSMQDDYAVSVGRDREGYLEVQEWGCFDVRRVLAWLSSGRAFAGAFDSGQPVVAGFKPWLEREWPEERREGVAVVKPWRFTGDAGRVAEDRQSGDDADLPPLSEDELPL